MMPLTKPEAPATGPDDVGLLEARVREAAGLLAQGDTEGTLAILEPITSDDSAYLPARFLLSMTAWKMGRLDWALEVMRQCHEIWPTNGAVAEALASLYAQSGNLGESFFMGKMGTALGGPGELYDLFPSGFPTFDWAFYHIKERPLRAAAAMCLAKGNVRDAIAKAHQHVALEPEDGDGRALYAEALLRDGAAAAAVEALTGMVGKTKASAEIPAAYASLYARALTAVGEDAEARRWHKRAAAQAPEDAVIAAAGVSDALWLAKSQTQMRAAGQDWVQRFCPPAEKRQWRRSQGRLVIGYFVSGFADRQDAAAVAAVARAHDRSKVTVIGYGRGTQLWPENALLRGVFDNWQDISSLDSATLTRFLERGGLHVIIDAAGFAAPLGLMALPRLSTAIRVAWLGNAAGVGSPIYDAQIVAESAASAGASAWHVAGSYPLLPPRRRLPPTPHAGIHFGADVNMAQLDKETIDLWSTVMHAQPEAKLLLRANDMAPGGNIDRLIARFGRELAARIDIVSGEGAEEFYAGVDVALTPRRGVSPRIAAEALACGVPAVALAGKSAARPYAAFLKDLGFGSMLVAADARDYAGIATGLATSPASREKIIAAIKLAASGEDGAGRFARAIEEHAAKALELAVELSS